MDRLTRIDHWIDNYAQTYPFSGIVRISLKDKPIFEKCVGFADREKEVPITSRTKFRLYSLTKPFTALAVMTLVDRGLVSLEAHPSEYVPGADVNEKVTVRSLLNHNSGLRDFAMLSDIQWAIDSYPVPKKEILRRFSVEHPLFPAGTDAWYGNFNFFLASLIVENVSGMSFDAYIRREIFEKIGMENACFDSRFASIPGKAKGYDIEGMQIVPCEYRSVDWMMGAGCGVAMASDVYQLNRAIKQRKLISEKAWQEVLAPAHGNFGLGMNIMKWHGKLRYTHNGGHMGFRTLHVQLPEDDFDIILLSNCGFGNARNAFSEAIYSIWYDDDAVADKGADMDRGFVRDTDIQGNVLNVTKPERVGGAGEYAGIYRNGSAVCELKPSGQDYLLSFGGRTFPVYYAGKGLFRHKVIDESYVFSEKGGTKVFSGYVKI